ncbi:MAG: hypothetical protein GTO41_20025 [Burkholderiales bacterium]|nr:hypothetical protein [Burkholderiales bacterium]
MANFNISLTDQQANDFETAAAALYGPPPEGTTNAQFALDQIELWICETVAKNAEIVAARAAAPPGQAERTRAESAMSGVSASRT